MASHRPHLMLLVSTTGYTGEAYRDAARSLGISTLVGSDRCHVLAADWPLEGMVTLDFRHPAEAVRQILQAARKRSIGAIVPTSEVTARIAALASRELGLRHNDPVAAEATGNKRIMRELLERAGVPAPRAQVFPMESDPSRIAPRVPFPCVLKPLLLSGSRGVIRADDPPAFCNAFLRIARLLAAPELLELHPLDSKMILVEPFVPGVEVAVEALLEAPLRPSADASTFRTLAIFDKPDPLDGPFFEETIYVTPSRLPSPTQARVIETAAAAARALGLAGGPVHAELRVGPAGVQVIEVAARSIGGLCSRALRFGTGTTLEEIVIRHAMDLPMASQEREDRAAGVMMIPIPRGGILTDVRGLEQAKAVAGIEDVVISAADRRLVPLPEGKAYLGFIFARGASPSYVEDALRHAHRELEFRIRTTL